MNDKRAKNNRKKKGPPKETAPAVDQQENSAAIADNKTMIEEEMSIADLCLGAAGASSEQIQEVKSGSIDDVESWSVNSLMNHPAGLEEALAQNLALMEQRTRDLIENGSAEDLMKALEENALQLQMLTERIANIAKASTHA